MAKMRNNFASFCAFNGVSWLISAYYLTCKSYWILVLSKFFENEMMQCSAILLGIAYLLEEFDAARLPCRTCMKLSSMDFGCLPGCTTLPLHFDGINDRTFKKASLKRELVLQSLASNSLDQVYSS